MRSRSPLPHIFDQPRVTASLGFVGLFAAGLALMLAPALFGVGVVICYSAAAVTIHRNWREIRSTVRSRRFAVSAPEGILLAGIIFTEIFVPTYLVDQYLFKEPKIHFQKFAIFWVNVSPNVYELGVVAKLFNEDSQSYQIKSLAFKNAESAWIPRGGYQIQRYTEFPDKLDIIIDDEVRANNVLYVKHMLPIRFEMTLIAGNTMDIRISKADWRLILDNATVKASPRAYVTYERPISLQQWTQLLRADSKINVDELPYSLF